MAPLIAILVIVVLLLIGISSTKGVKRLAKNRMVSEAIRHHLASYLRDRTGKGPWFQMDEFYRRHSFEKKCIGCSQDTVYVCNDNTSRETEFIYVHFKKGKLTVFLGEQALFDGDPLLLMSYGDEAVPLRKEKPPPRESDVYARWVELFKESGQSSR